MTTVERNERLLRIAKKFTQVGQQEKDFTAGYITGVTAERAKWMQELNTEEQEVENITKQTA